jgi:hypothetical protein
MVAVAASPAISRSVEREEGDVDGVTQASGRHERIESALQIGR